MLSITWCEWNTVRIDVPTYLLFTHKKVESLHHIAMCNGTIDNFSKSALHYLHF